MDHSALTATKYLNLFLNFRFDYKADFFDILEFKSEVEHMERLKGIFFPIQEMTHSLISAERGNMTAVDG